MTTRNRRGPQEIKDDCIEVKKQLQELEDDHKIQDNLEPGPHKIEDCKK